MDSWFWISIKSTNNNLQRQIIRNHMAQTIVIAPNGKRINKLKSFKVAKWRKDESRMMEDEWRMMKDERWMMISSCWGVLQTDRWMDGRTTILNSCSFQRHIEYILKYLCICVTIHSKKDIFSLIVRGKLGSKTYQYFIFLFFTLSVERGRGTINDAIFTLSAVFSFWWLP